MPYDDPDLDFSSVAAKPALNYDGLLRNEATRQGVDPEHIVSLSRAESSLNPSARSPKGAIGLMQVMPATGRRYGVKPLMLADPATNARVGVSEYKRLLGKYNDPKLAVAAYNAGEGAVDSANGVPRFQETKNHVKKVIGGAKYSDPDLDFTHAGGDPDLDFGGTVKPGPVKPSKPAFAWNAGSTPTVPSARPAYQPAKLAAQSASPDDGRLTPAESAYDSSVGPLGKDFAETITKPAPVIRAARQARQPVRMTLPGQSDEERAAQRATSDAAKVQREESRRTAANQTISNYLGVPLPRVATEAIADAAHGLGEGTGRAIEGAGQYAEDLRRKLGYENTSSAITKAGQSLREMGEQASTVGGAPEGLLKDIATEIGGIIPALLAKNPTMIGELAALQAKGRGATNAEALTQGAMAGLTVGGMGKGASIISRLVPGAGVLPALTRFGGRAAVNTAIPIAANAAERAMQGEPIEPPPGELRKEIIHSGVMGAGFALLPHPVEAKRDISRQPKHPYVRAATVDPSSPSPGFLRRLESFRAEVGRDRVPRDAAIPPRFGNARAQYEAQRAAQEQEPIVPRTPVQPTEPGVESAIAQGVGVRQPLQSPRLVKRAGTQDIKQAASPVEDVRGGKAPVFHSETGPVGHDEMVGTLDDLLSLIPERATRQRIIDESVAEGGASYENVVRAAFRKAEEATSGEGGNDTPEPPSDAGIPSTPSSSKGLTRNFRAGNNDASMTFADDAHRDLYDLGAKMRYLGRGGQNKPSQRDVGDIAGLRKKLSERLSIPQADIGRMAMDTLDDVKAQMKGVKHGEGRHLVNNVQAPTPTVTTIKNRAPQTRTVNPESDSLLAAIQKLGFDSTTPEGSDLARYLSPREGGRPGMVNNQRLNGGERRGVDNYLIRSLQEAGFDIKDSNDLMDKVRQEQSGKPVYSTAYDHAAQAARELKPYLGANHSPEIAQTVNTLAEAINNHSEFGQLSDKIAHGEATDVEIKRFGEVGRYELNIDPDAIQSFIETHENPQQSQGRGAELGVETGKSSQQLTKRKISKRQDDVKHRDLYDYFPDQFSVGGYDVSKVTSAASARKGEQEYGYRWHDKKSGRLGSVVIRTTDTGDLDIEPVGASKDVPQEVLNELQNQLTPAFNQQMQRGAERAAGEREGDVNEERQTNTPTAARRRDSLGNQPAPAQARTDYIHDTLNHLTERAKSTRRSLSDLVDEHIGQAPLPGQEAIAFTPEEVSMARRVAANYDSARSTRRAPVKEQQTGFEGMDVSPTLESKQAAQAQAESQQGEGLANSPLFEGVKTEEQPHHSELQPRTPEGRFDGPPTTPEYVKPSSVETVHQSELQGALQLKADAWKKVKELRTRIANEPLGGNRSGLRLQLMNWQDAHGKAIELERQARQAIEGRANELKQTTVKPKPAPDFTLKEPPQLPAKGEHGHFINALFKSPDVDNQVPSFLANPEVRAKLGLPRTGKPAETKDALAKAMDLPRSSHISPETLRAWAGEQGLGQDALSAIDSAHAQYRAKLRAKELGGRDDDPDIITQYRNDLGKKSGDLSVTLLSDPERGYKAVTVLGYDLYQTAKDFGNWSRQMVGKFGERIRPMLRDLWNGIKNSDFVKDERGYLRFGKGEKTTTEPVTNKRLEQIFKANKGEGDMPPPRRRFKQGALDDLFKTDEKVTVEAAHQTMQDAWDDFTEPREPAKANAARAGEAYYEQGKKAPDKLLSFRTLDSWMKANMLQGMSPYSHKVGSLASNALAEAASTPGAAAADWVISKAKGGRRSVVVDPKGMGKAAASAVTTGAREAMQIMRQGATQKQIEQYGMPNQLNTRSPIVNAMVNYTFRTYKAGAHIFGTMAYQKALSNQAKAWALNEVTAGKIRGNEVSRRTQEILNGSDIPEGVTATMEGNATLAYADAVFQSENKLNDVRKNIIGTGNGAWAFAVNRVVPFMKSASNAYLKMLDYTGVGPKSAIAETGRAIQRKSSSGQAFRTLEDQRAAATAWGKLPVGLGLFTAGIILHRNGLMTSLTYQHDDNPQPGSVRAFGKLIDVARYSPIGLIMAAGATFDELSHDKDNDALTAGVKVVAKGASNLPMFSQTTDLVKTAQALAEGKASVPGIGGAIGKSLLTRTAPTIIPGYATVRDVKGGIEQSDKYVAGPLGKMMHVQNQLTEPRSADEVKIHEADRAAHPLPPISDLKKTEVDAKGEITRAMQSHDKNTPAIIQKHIASGAIKQEDVYDIADKASKSDEQRMIEGFKRLPLEEMANQYVKLSPAGRAKVRQEFQEAAMDQLPNLTPLQQKTLGPKIGQALRAQ